MIIRSNSSPDAAHRAHSLGSSHGGFTLIELMVTVAIVAILGTIAVESYTSQVQKSRRTDARSTLLDIAGREEKLYSVSNAYSGLPTGIPSDVGYSGAAWPVIVGANQEYSVTVSSPDPAQGGAAGTYAITATAVGIQAADTTCATLTLNQTGLQGSTGTGTPATCWGN